MKYFFIIIAASLSWLGCQRSVQSIAYLTNRDGNFNLYLTDPLGKKHLALTENPGWDWSPRWNPFHKGIIYNSTDTSEQFSIRMVDLNGNEMPLSTFDLTEFILAPDGKVALYTVSDSLDKAIYGLNLLTHEKVPLVSTPGYNGRPRWAPNSSCFSFISDRTGTNEIFLYELGSGKVRQLTNNSLTEKYISWKGDNKSLVFTATEPEKDWNDIYELNLSTQTVSRMTQDTLLYEEINWSADGKTIAFHGKWDGDHHIYTLRVKGNRLQRITKTKAYHGEPEWVGPLK